VIPGDTGGSPPDPNEATICHASFLTSVSTYQRRPVLLEHLGDIAANLEPFVRHYGVFAVSLVLTLESLGVPLPGETLLIFASVLGWAQTWDHGPTRQLLTLIVV
jgi:hypothetical protein